MPPARGGHVERRPEHAQPRVAELEPLEVGPALPRIKHEARRIPPPALGPRRVEERREEPVEVNHRHQRPTPTAINQRSQNATRRVRLVMTKGASDAAGTPVQASGVGILIAMRVAHRCARAASPVCFCASTWNSPPLKLLEKNLVFPNPPGLGVTTAYEYEYYARPTGVEKIRLRFMDISDDIFDDGSLSFSTDNGRTWRDQRPHMVGRKTAEGTLRRFDGLGWTDPVEGKLLNLYLDGLFRKDNNLEGMQQYYLNYRVSDDGGAQA